MKVRVADFTKNDILKFCDNFEGCRDCPLRLKDGTHLCLQLGAIQNPDLLNVIFNCKKKCNKCKLGYECRKIKTLFDEEHKEETYKVLQQEYKLRGIQ